MGNGNINYIVRKKIYSLVLSVFQILILFFKETRSRNYVGIRYVFFLKILIFIFYFYNGNFVEVSECSFKT